VRSLVEVLGARWSKPGGWVTVAASRAEAHYRLIGQPGPSGPEYSLVRAARMTGQVGALPLRTDRYSIAEAEGGPAAAAAELNEAAQRLARAYAWIVLRSPALSDAKFPYRLALRGRNGIVKHDGDVVVKDETYGLSLTADPGALGDRVQPRWVYVFAMDSHGRRQLVFPRSGFGDVENRVPVGKVALPEVVLTASTFTVAPPFGRDSFFMLATENKLPDPEALNEDGVRTRGLRGAGGDPLPVDLLLPVTQRTRGFAVVPLPADWTLQRIEVKSVEASK
jgi:hypothetical protein